MGLGPIFARELLTASRRRGVFAERGHSACLVLVVMAACLLVWDHMGKDRVTLTGMREFSYSTFAAVVCVLTVLAMAMVPAGVAPGVAGERDRKTLDALLATRLTSAEVVLGTLAAGLVRQVTYLAVGFSVAALMVPFAGIDPRLVGLAFAGILATAFAVGAVSVAVSVCEKSAVRGVGEAVAIVWGSWAFAPLLTIVLLRWVWAPVAKCVYPVALVVLDSSPMGVLANLTGMSRRSTPVESVAWMIGYEVLGGALLVAWSIWQLRPVSRALYDSEGRSLLRKMGQSRRRSRRPCGDDPVFWNEKYAQRSGATGWTLLAGELVSLVMLWGLLYATYHFAKPAVLEVIAYGYTGSPGSQPPSDLNPFARALVRAVSPGGTALALPAGQARKEFNTVLRVTTSLFYTFCVLIVGSFASESLTGERERDTWSGLIATPLTGRDILRAKILGTFWRVRWPAGVMAGLWLVGLAAGALHPLGFLAEILGLAVSGWFVAAVGVWTALWSRDRKHASNRLFMPIMVLAFGGSVIMFLPRTDLSVVVGVGSSPVYGVLSLLSYDDVRAATSTGAFAYLVEIGAGKAGGAAAVLVTCLATLIGQAVGAFLLTRASYRGFDAAVGRPVRGASGGERSPAD